MKFKDQLDPKYTRLSLYVIATCIIIYILYAFTSVIPTIVTSIASFLHWLGMILVPVFWGFVIAYLLDPLVDFVQRFFQKFRNKKRVVKQSRTLAITTVIVMILLAIIVLFSVIISAFSKEIQIANFTSITNFINEVILTIQSFIADLVNNLEQTSINSETISSVLTTITEWIKTNIANFGTNIVSNASAVTGFFTNLVFSIIFGIYFLADGDSIKAYWGNVFKTFTSKRVAHLTKVFLNDCDTVFSGYIRGQLLDASFVAVTISIALSFTNVKFPVVIGLLGGFGNLIPYVGALLADVVMVLICLINGDFVTMIICLIIITIIQMIDGQIVNPRLLGSNVNVHPMMVAIALIIGGKVSGLLGMLFAVPVAALVKIQFDRLVRFVQEKRKLNTHENSSAS